MTYSVRAFKGPDLPTHYVGFIFAKWLRTHRSGNDFARLIAPDAYYAVYGKLIASILSRPDSLVRLAILSDDPDVILGFSVSRGTILDYVYVHAHQRRTGIATSLVPSGIDTFTHVTKTALTIWASKFGTWKFNPFT